MCRLTLSPLGGEHIQGGVVGLCYVDSPLHLKEMGFLSSNLFLTFGNFHQKQVKVEVTESVKVTCDVIHVQLSQINVTQHLYHESLVPAAVQTRCQSAQRCCGYTVVLGHQSSAPLTTLNHHMMLLLLLL